MLDLIKRNRSYRRFYQEVKLPAEVMDSLLEAARLCPSAANRQVLKYVVCRDAASPLGKEIFDCLAWAGYLPQWPGPEAGERPSAYLVVLHDTSLYNNPNCDAGIAMQSVLLEATSQGFGGCIFAAINRPRLAKYLHLPEHLVILNVVALGKPKEQVVIDTLDTSLPNGEAIKYWRDGNQVHHVPKRAVEDIVFTPTE